VGQVAVYSFSNALKERNNEPTSLPRSPTFPPSGREKREGRKDESPWGKVGELYLERYTQNVISYNESTPPNPGG